MSEYTSLNIKKETKKKFWELKKFRETDNDLLERLIKAEVDKEVSDGSNSS